MTLTFRERKNVMRCWLCGQAKMINRFSLACRTCEKDAGLKIERTRYVWIREDKEVIPD